MADVLDDDGGLRDRRRRRACCSGSLVGSSRFIYSALYPLLVGFNSIPKAAFVPILVVWFGIGTVPAILTAFLICFFPIVVNVATGLATLEPELEDVLRSLGATRRGRAAQGRPAALAAVLLRLAQGGDHAGVRRHGRVRDRRVATTASAT